MAFVLGSGLCLGSGFGNPTTPRWGLGWVCLGTVCGFAPLFLAGVRGVCGWAWVSACTPPVLVRVVGGARLCARSSCSPLFLVLVCDVGVCVGVRVAAAPRLFLGRCCWGVRAVVRVPHLPPPFLGGRLWRGGVLVLPLVGCAPTTSPLVLYFGALWCRSLVVPVLGLVVAVPPSLLFRAALFAVCVFFFQRGVCPCVLCVPSPVGPLPSAWCCRFWLAGPPAPLRGVLSSVPSWWGVWPPLVVLVGGVVAVRRFRAPPPLPRKFFFRGGVCLFLPLPSLDWRTHWPAFCVVFRFAVGGCVLPSRAPAPWVGWVMYTLGSAPLPAGLGSGSAGWAVVPGGFVWLWVRGSGVVRVLSPPGFRFYLSGWTASIVAGRAVAPCRCVAGQCGSFRVVRWLVLVSPSGYGQPGRGVPLCAASRPVVLWRVVFWGALSCCVALWCAAVRHAVLPRVVPWLVGGG